MSRSYCFSAKALLCCLGILTLILSARTARCQFAGSGVARQSWTTEDGLPQNSVHAILQTRDGFLWVATEGGVSRYDGFSFRTFRQANEPAFTSDDTCCLVEDAVGGLWIGTADGVVREVGGRFQHIGLTGVASADVKALAANHDGSVLVLTASGLASIANDGRFAAVRITSGDAALAMTTAVDGSVWVATANSLFRYNDGGLQLHQPLPVLQSVIASISVVPAKGMVWVRSAHEVVLLRDGRQQHVWKVGDELPGTRIESLVVDPHGIAWVGTNRGLVRIEADGSSISNIAATGASSVLVTAQDRDGDMWVGTEASGLTVLRPQAFQTVSAVANEKITTVVQTTDGAIWMGTSENGLWRKRGDQIDRPAQSARLVSPVILALTPGAHDDLWVGTPDGLNYIDGNSVRTYTSANGLPDDFVRSLLADPDGSVWVGTRRGLAHLSGPQGNLIATYTRHEGLKSDMIGALLRPPASSSSSQDLWIVTLDGLSRLRDGHITTWTKAAGLSGSVITSLAMDASGSLWLGSENDGLDRFADGAFTSFRQIGMPANIGSILSDSHGALWLGTRHGVERVAFSALHDCSAKPECALAVAHYGYPDGLPSEDLSSSGHPAAWETNDGQLWFATLDGVAFVDPAQISYRAALPLIAIERLLADDVEMPLSGEELRIAPGRRSVSIEYAGLSFHAPSRLRFRYKLDGFDQRWTDAGSRREAYYTNLSPGSYRFVVQAAGSDGLWSQTGGELRFSVLPPFYRRWWFYVLALVAIGGVLLLLHLLRLRGIKREFNAVLAERNRIAREIHDTLAQDFVGVSVQLEVVTQMLARADVPAAAAQINATRKLVRDGLEDARQSIWELRAAGARESLPNRLAGVVKRAADRGLKTECKIGGTYRELPRKYEEELLRISQEAIANVLKHAEARTVSVDLRYSTDRLLLRIVDDGCGFAPRDVSSEEKHFGLKGMQERAAAIGAICSVLSSMGEGTTVTVEVPI